MINQITKDLGTKDISQKHNRMIRYTLDNSMDGKVSKEELVTYANKYPRSRWFEDILLPKVRPLLEETGPVHELEVGYRKITEGLKNKLKRVKLYPGNMLEEYSLTKDGKLTSLEFEQLVLNIEKKVFGVEAHDSFYFQLLYDMYAVRYEEMNKQELKSALIYYLEDYIKSYEEGEKRMNTYVKETEIKYVLKEIGKLDDPDVFEQEAKELFGLIQVTKTAKAAEKSRRKAIRKGKDVGNELPKGGKIVQNPTDMNKKKFRKVVDQFYDDIDANFIEMAWDTKNMIFRNNDEDYVGKLDYLEFKGALRDIIRQFRNMLVILFMKIIFKEKLKSLTSLYSYPYI